MAANMNAGGLVNASRFVTAMIDPGIVSSGGEVAVCNVLPTSTCLFYPFAVTRFAARLLLTPTLCWLSRFVILEKLVGATLNSIEHPTAKH